MGGEGRGWEWGLVRGRRGWGMEVSEGMGDGEDRERKGGNGRKRGGGEFM